MEMYKKIFVVLALFLVTSMVIQGCANKTVTEPQQPSTEPSQKGEIKNVNEIDNDLKELEELEQELNLEDLDNLDKDLKEVDW